MHIQKWKFCYRLLTLMLLQTCILLQKSRNVNKDILNNVGNQTVLVPFDFHCILPIEWKSKGTETVWLPT